MADIISQEGEIDENRNNLQIIEEKGERESANGENQYYDADSQVQGKEEKSQQSYLENSVVPVKQTVELQKRILAKTKTEKNNYLSLHNKFETVGSNGLFTASPAIVKFAGFELQKTHTLKVKLINNSPAPQRLHILPPSTQYFKIKYNKKGMVPSGVSEDIYVQFTPANDFKYFYDSIRIHCEGDKILIPIHAYPVINSKQDELLPKSVDLGKGCKVGEVYQQIFSIKSNCPINFEYEIKEIVSHPEIRLFPMSGDILGNQKTPLTFQYLPQSYTTAIAEYEIRTSEFDFKPQLIRVIGSSQPQKSSQYAHNESQALADASTDDHGEDEQSYLNNVIKKKGRTLLTDKNTRRSNQTQTGHLVPGFQLDPINEKSLKKRTTSKLQSQGDGKSTIDQSSSVRNLEKLQQDDQNFQKEFRRLEDLEREKGIKFFECIGDPPMSYEFKENVYNQRQKFIQDKNDIMRKKDLSRFKTVINSDKVVIPVKNDIQSQPKWDVYKNNHFTMKKRLCIILLKAATKIIIRIRAEKRLKAIKKRLQEEKILTREDCKKLVQEDWKKAQNATQENVDDLDDKIENIKFKFCFNQQEICSDIKLPLQYDANIASYMEKIEATPIYSFDDSQQFEPIEQLDFEVEKYQPFQLPQVSTYDPVFKEKQPRPGCEYEGALRQRAGEPDLEKIQVAAHEQMELLKQKKKDNVSGANVDAPKSFYKPFDYSHVLLLRPHPTLRVFQQQLEMTEVDPAYHLYPYKRERIEPKDEISLQNVKNKKEKEMILSQIESQSGSFINQTIVPTHDIPGNFGVRVLETMPTDIREVHIDQHNNIQLGFKCDERPSEIPELLMAPDQNDYLTDEESDEANDFQMKIPVLDDLISQFENDDEVIQKEKVQLKEYVKDQIKIGFEPEKRYDIKNSKQEKIKMLEDNISKQREFQSQVLQMKLNSTFQLGMSYKQ